jgi:hypothetical protein
MSKGLRLSVMALVGATAAGVIGFTAPAVAQDDNGGGLAFKREDDSGQVVTTKHGGDDDDDDGATNGTSTNTNTGAGTDTGTGTGADTDTGTRTRGANTDHSRSGKVKDLTNDGPGRNNVDHSRGHTNDGSRHNTRG